MSKFTKVRGRGDVVGEMPLALASAHTERYGALTAADTSRWQKRNSAACASVVGQCQEMLDGAVADRWGDSLCSDWTLFSAVAKEDRRLASAMLLDRVTKFMLAPHVVMKKIEALGIQEYTTKGDFPAEVLNTIEKYHVGIEEIDVVWRKIFDVKDFTNTKKGGFKIRDVASGLTFRRVPTGDKVDVYKMAGSEVEVLFDNYGGALGWDRKWFQDEEFWMVSDTAKEFRNKYFNDMADVHYALIEALPAGINEAWAAPTPAGLAVTDPLYQLVRDVNTMNAACYAIINNLESQGMDVTASVQFQGLAPLALKARLQPALEIVLGMASLRNPTRVQYSIVMDYTNRLASNTQYYICVPKRKAKSGNRINLEMFADFDILSYSDTTAGWGRYGGGIGENNQFRRCLTA